MLSSASRAKCFLHEGAPLFVPTWIWLLISAANSRFCMFTSMIVIVCQYVMLHNHFPRFVHNLSQFVAANSWQVPHFTHPNIVHDHKPYTVESRIAQRLPLANRDYFCTKRNHGRLCSGNVPGSVTASVLLSLFGFCFYARCKTITLRLEGMALDVLCNTRNYEI